MSSVKHRIPLRPPILAVLLLASASLLSSTLRAGPPREQLKIAVVLDGPSVSAETLLEMSRAELERFGYEAGALFSDARNRTGDFSGPTARRLLADALKDPRSNLVWAFGPISSAAAVEAALAGRLSKPVVAPFVFDEASRRLRAAEGASTRLAHVVFTPSLSRDLSVLSAALPVRRLAFILAEPIREAIPDAASILQTEAAKLGVDLEVVSGPDPAEMVRGLSDDIDAVYVGFDPRRTPSQLKLLSEALLARGLPSFSQLGRLEVEQGLLMGVGNPENAQRLTRAVAVHTDAILRGERPGSPSYAFQSVENLVINDATARRLKLALSWSVLSEAELVAKTEVEDAEKFDLRQLVEQVRNENLSVRASAEEVGASEQAVGEAIGALLPSLDTSVSGAVVDPDGASGLNPERSLSWSASASQVLVNEPALAQLSVNQHLRDAARFDNQTTALDQVEAASTGYLDVLRSMVTEEIQRENLRVTKTEMAQARVRLAVGSGSQSELLRLENQLANNRTSVIDAVATRNVAELELLRLLNRATEDPLILADMSLESSPLMRSGERLRRFMTGPQRFNALRGFMAQEALRHAPELKAAASRLAAQRRQALSAQLALFVPRVTLSGSVTQLIDSGGAGTSPEEQAIFPINDFNWQVGISASLPLFEGTARYRRIGQADADARRLALELEARSIQVQTSLRSLLHRAGASYANIELQRDAAEAADRNLALIREGYARGKENIITLVDAQNQALTGRLNANTAVYNFLIDLLEVQRTMGRFALLLSDAEIEAFFRRLQTFASTQEDHRE
ncbi:MAG: TolC family protein [Myxococcota bacterium]